MLSIDIYVLNDVYSLLFEIN